MSLKTNWLRQTGFYKTGFGRETGFYDKPDLNWIQTGFKPYPNWFR